MSAHIQRVRADNVRAQHTHTHTHTHTHNITKNLDIKNATTTKNITENKKHYRKNKTTINKKAKHKTHNITTLGCYGHYTSAHIQRARAYNVRAQHTYGYHKSWHKKCKNNITKKILKQK